MIPDTRFIAAVTFCIAVLPTVASIGADLAGPLASSVRRGLAFR
jgi:hypothetical protein